MERIAQVADQSIYPVQISFFFITRQVTKGINIKIMSHVIFSKDDDHNHTQMSVSFYWASLQWFYHRHRHRKYTDLLLLNSVLFLAGLWAKRKKTNKEVLNKLGLQSTKLMTVVRQRIVRFYGHVRRHDSIQRIITEGMVNGKRGRGRKRCGWLGNVSR